MKRCPQCEFTFDDHQESCDFDGAELSVVPQLGTSLKNVPLPATESPSPFLNALRSPITLSAILLVVVTPSALWMGYYDAAKPPESASVAKLEHGEQIEINSSSQGPNYVSMERRVTTAKEASAMPSSTIEWLTEDPESESSQARSNPSSGTPAALRANPRRASRSNGRSLANNQRGVSKPSNQLAHRGPNKDSADRRRQKDSRVVAILKKTGSILSWPFKL